jgi:excinuclease UvrABC ATPase subunit
MDGWYGRIFRGAGFDMDKPIRKYNKKELHNLLYQEPTKVKVEGINLTYEGLIPKIQKSMLSKEPEAMQPHIRAFVERAVTFTTCPDCDGTRLSEAARSSKIEGRNIAELSAMQISDLAEWVRGLDEPSVAPLLASLQHTLESFVEIGLGYLCARPAVGHAVGRRGAAAQDDPPPRIVAHRRHLRVRRAHDRAPPARHRADERAAAATARQGQHRLVVEHKPEAIAIADHVVDLGPSAGSEGGEVVFEGTVEGLRRERTLTGRHLDDRARSRSRVRTPPGARGPRGRRRTTCRTSTSTSRSASWS